MNSSLKAALILVVVFAIGGMAGFTVAKRSNDRPLIGRGLDPFRMERGVVEHIEKRLTETYDLTDEQKAGVRKILEDSQMKYDAFFHETRPTFDQIRRAQQDAIRALMTPDQTEKFNTWLEERRKRRGERGTGPGREGGPRSPKGMKAPKGPPPDGAADSSNN